jgi:hypothetical protein
MKKQTILMCFQNYYVIENYKYDLEVLAREFDISIIISNFRVNKKIKVKLIDFLKSIGVKKFYIVPFYKKSNGVERNLLSILNTHLYLLYLRVKIEFRLFKYCISDSRIFIWQKIILENLLSKRCLQVGISNDPILLPTKKIKELLDDKDILEIIKSVHKLREIIPTEKVKKKKKIRIRISNTFKRLIDSFFDRVFLSYIFYARNFSYDEYDLNVNGETKKYDIKITFYYSSFIFWKKWYKDKNKNVYLLKAKDNCKCKNQEKNKIIFLSSGPLISLELENSLDKINKIKLQSINIAKFVNSQFLNNPNLREIDIRHHPRGLKFNKDLFNKHISNNLNKNIKINILKDNKPISDIACEYGIAFGMMSAVLDKFSSSCNDLKVYCLKSLSKERFGEEYFLKLLNENILFYDDENYELDNNYNEYTTKFKKEKKQIFSEFILNIFNK